MRGILAIGLVSVSACSGGPGTTVFNGTDQTSPPNYTQSPINGTQQAALDPQAAPPLDPQSVPPSASGSVGGNQAKICDDWCHQQNALCAKAASGASDGTGGPSSGAGDSVQDCVTDCNAEVAKRDRCTNSLFNLVECVMASPEYQCSLKEKDLPAACTQAFSAWQACNELLNPSQPVPNQKGTGGAGQGNPGSVQTGGASQGSGGIGRTGGVGQGTGGVAAF